MSPFFMLVYRHFKDVGVDVLSSQLDHLESKLETSKCDSPWLQSRPAGVQPRHQSAHPIRDVHPRQNPAHQKSEHPAPTDAACLDASIRYATEILNLDQLPADFSTSSLDAISSGHAFTESAAVVEPVGKFSKPPLPKSIWNVNKSVIGRRFDDACCEWKPEAKPRKNLESNDLKMFAHGDNHRL
jgi:hypothetical protein